MNAFDIGRGIEARSVAKLRGLLRDKCDDGRYVIISKGPLAPVIQEIAGDLCMNRDGAVYFAELKAEEQFTGNLFIEVFSNRCLANRDDHARYGMKPGWAITNGADLLLYHFLDVDDVYVIDFYRFKRWFFGSGVNGERDGVWWKYGASGFQRVQQKYRQRNETVGILVPIKDIPRRTVLLHKWSVANLELVI